MKAFVSLLAALCAVACTPISSIPPGSPESQARGTLGAPAAEFDYPDGTHQLVYPRGPLGTETYMVFLKGGTVQRVEQALTDDNFYRIQAGVTTADQVRRMIGPPGRVVRFENLQQFAWDYRFRDTWGYLAIFSVTFGPDHRIISKFSRRVNVGGDGRP